MTAKATFGAGCFWGVEATFRLLPGVTATTVGYAGGRLANPSYEQVCTDRSGHAEVVQVEYDPARLDYATLLQTFWQAHDPTQVNRQGHDLGSQYRSVIFVHDEAQRAAAEESKARLAASRRYRRAIATAIEAASDFWPAEDYHQRFLEKRGAVAACTLA